MLPRIRLLTLTVTVTVILLTVGALLVVVGIFDESLDWDIFGPKLERFLYAVFGASVALAGFGVAITVVLGTLEIVSSFRAIEKSRAPADAGARPEPARKHYLLYMVGILLLLAVIVGALSFANQQVLEHRSRVFKRVAEEQMAVFEPRLRNMVSGLRPGESARVPQELHDLLRSLSDLSFVAWCSIYLADLADPAVLWTYGPSQSWRHDEDKFRRFYVAKDFEKAVRQALSGDNSDLAQVNKDTGFSYYHVVEDDGGKPCAVVRVEANKHENFREYKLGS